MLSVSSCSNSDLTNVVRYPSGLEYNEIVMPQNSGSSMHRASYPGCIIHQQSGHIQSNPLATLVHSPRLFWHRQQRFCTPTNSKIFKMTPVSSMGSSIPTTKLKPVKTKGRGFGFVSLNISDGWSQGKSEQDHYEDGGQEIRVWETRQGPHESSSADWLELIKVVYCETTSTHGGTLKAKATWRIRPNGDKTDDLSCKLLQVK